MALDGIILSKVREDLERHLPIRINKINGTSETEIIFNVHADGIRTSLVVSLHSIYNHISLSDKNYSDYEEPSTFIMVLRKYLTNGIIHSIEQHDYDRYLLLYIKALNDMYDEKEYILSVELMGKYANLILIDKETGKIIDALKKIPPFQNTKRTILQGAVFALPDKQHKKDPFTAEDIDFDDSLVKQLQGFSKQLEQEVRYRLDRQSFKEIMNEIRDSRHLYITSNNEYHVIPLTNLNEEYKEYDFAEGFDVLYYKSNEKERIRTVTEDVSKFIKRQIKHYELKLSKLQNSLEEGKTLNDDKKNGELLYTYSDLDRKGLKEIEVTDYSGRLKTIKLDPKLSVKANANKYYNTYSKKRKGKAYIEEQIEIAGKEREYFTALKEQLDIASYSDALEIKEELIRYGYLKKRNNKIRKKKNVNLYQVRTGDRTITFGKNNTQNDYLTFSYAKPNYTWFHAKDYHGAHLVVDTDRPDEATLRLCANLAAYYSQGRYSGSVPVDYCLVKDVKKIKGAKAGFVTFRNHKTIYIDPEKDPDLVITAI
ncbi:MAG: NFACT family protein [Erysipelotrichaceae bacterium]|nr:NFACT family protein [Erysipelotrichaceae bacterium]